MPRRDDIHKILLIGSGPIVIGQAAEFDYSGTQACRVLMQEGYEVVLVNSNPATIMTDPEVATTTYIEPLLPGPVAQVIERERPDALLPTLGGQTALNLAKALHEDGTLERYGVELIGADYEAIDRAEDRERFRETMTAAGLRVPRSVDRPQHRRRPRGAADDRAAVHRPPGVHARRHRRRRRPHRGRDRAGRRPRAWPPRRSARCCSRSRCSGWGEFELEVMRDHTDNVVIVCSIENLDPMGVHTGDSVCVAPQQTLTDKQYQALRDQAIAVIRAVGVETGGSNVQFAVNRGHRRDRRDRDEPARVALERAGQQGDRLPDRQDRRPAGRRLHAAGDPQRHHARDAGELRAGDRLLRGQVAAVRVREVPRRRGRPDHAHEVGRRGDGDRPHVQAGVRQGAALARARHRAGRPRRRRGAAGAGADAGRRALRPPARGAAARGLGRRAARRTEHRPVVPARAGASCVADPGRRRSRGERTFKSVDTCAAEFAAQTPYFYSGWERPGAARRRSHEVARGERPSVVILGSGPNRIGQGIEFDYCCVHAAQTVREPGRDAVMINCNPETVSTDYDTSDRLYFEPLTLEDVLAVCELETARGRGRPVRRPDAAEARRRPATRPGSRSSAPASTRSTSPRTARASARCSTGSATRRRRTRPRAAPRRRWTRAPEVGFPLLVRPSYVLGGRAMEIVYSVDGLRDYLERVGTGARERAIYLDRFLEDSIEVDVDALCDGDDVWIAGIMQHVEEAGIHSGDSACVLPPHALGEEMLDQIREQTTGIARALGVVGLLNVQFAIHGDDGLHVIEANPRASRTVPFVSKAIGLPLAKLACRIMLGERIAELDLPAETDRRPRVRQGGRAAVRPLRRRRLAARSRDALDRRGDGDRRRLPDRVRQGPGGGRRQAAQPGHRVHHRRRRRQAGRHRDRHLAARPRLRDRRHPRHRPGACGGWGSRRPRSTRSARARRTSSTGSSGARSTW